MFSLDRERVRGKAARGAADWYERAVWDFATGLHDLENFGMRAGIFNDVRGVPKPLRRMIHQHRNRGMCYTVGIDRDELTPTYAY